MAEGELQISFDKVAGGRVVRLAGVIDTHFPREKLVEAAKGVVVFDLDGVGRITSYGVREWIKALKEIDAEYYCFVRCRPIVVAQLNTIAHFAGRGELLSFYLPYVCKSCEQYTDVLLDVRKEHAAVRSFSPPAAQCKHCGSPADFDDAPRSYFSFAAKARLPTPPQLVDAMLSGAAPTADPFQVEKDVGESVTCLRFSGTLDTGANLRRLAEGLEGPVLVTMDGVTQATPEGLHRLEALLNAPDATLYLTGLREPLARKLAAEPKTMGRATLLSARVPFNCPACHLETEQDTFLDALVDASMVTPCPRCRSPLAPQASPAFLEALAALPKAAPSAEIRAYLDQRANPSPEGAAGDRRFGRYELIRALGMGGMAEVFLARQTAVAGFEKKVVLKRILPQLSSDQHFVTMFLDEARMSARISHPNVVQIFDLGQVGAQYFIAMEFVNGWDLNVVMRACAEKNTPFPIELAARVAADICAGLNAAHSCTDEEGHARPIIHRDVSPHNVLVSADGQVKLTDFGIAKAIDSSTRTPLHTLKGKLAYMAPEQGRGGGAQIDGRADIFPTGIILHECITLNHLFERENDFATLAAIMNDPIPRMSTALPSAPPFLQQILDKALAREPEERYQTALEFQNDLERLIVSLGKPATAADLARWLNAHAPPPGTSGRSSRPGTKTHQRGSFPDP